MNASSWRGSWLSKGTALPLPCYTSSVIISYSHSLHSYCMKMSLCLSFSHMLSKWQRNGWTTHIPYSPRIIRVAKSVTMRRAGHVVHMGKMRNVWKMYTPSSEDLKGRDCVGDLVVDGKIILRWMLNSVMSEFTWLRRGASGGLL